MYWKSNRVRPVCSSFFSFLAPSSFFKPGLEMGKRPKNPPVTRISQRQAKQPTPTPTTLPPELWAMIFSYLFAPDLCTAKSVCRYWRSLVSTTPLRALCVFEEYGIVLPNTCSIMAENESLRAYIDQHSMEPHYLGYFLVPGLTPPIIITVESLNEDWDTYPSNSPLFDTIRQMVVDRCGLNVTLVLYPSGLKPARFPARFGIPVFADWGELKQTIFANADIIWPVAREYLSTIAGLHIADLDDKTQLRNALALMPNINHVVVFVAIDSADVDFGLDTLPNLQNLDIHGLTISRKLLGDIANLRHLERLQFLENIWDEVDWDAACDMFTALPRLWFFSVDDESNTIISTIQTSEKLRCAMGNITHFVVREISAFESLDAIETLSQLENIKNILVYVDHDEDDNMRNFADVSAARAKARELQSARLSIQILIYCE
jgi:hypothetical protein